MAYEPTNWQNGDIITAEKLNKMENGIGNLIIEWIDDENDLLVSYQDITDALSIGKMVYLKHTFIDENIPTSFAPLTAIGIQMHNETPIYSVMFYPVFEEPHQFGSTDPTYPLRYNFNGEPQ